MDTLPPDLQFEQDAIKRKRAIAEMLMQNSMQPLEPPVVKGRFQGAINPLQGFAKLLNAYNAKEGLASADKSSAGIADKYRTGLADAVTKHSRTYVGTPEIPMPADELGGGPGAPAVAGDPRRAIVEAMTSPYAPVQRIGQMDMTHMNRQEDLAVADKRARELQAAMLADKKEGREATDQTRRDLADNAEVTRRDLAADADRRAREMQQFVAANRPPKNEPAPSVKDIIDPLNPSQMIAVDTRVFNEDAYKKGNRAGVIGTSGKEPVGAKREDKAAEGKDLLRSELDNLREHFKFLNEKRAIPSDDRSVASNVASSIQASGPGQLAGRIGGTKEQSARNEIQSARLRVLNAVKNATGMSAQQLNSNAELKTWLDSLTSLSGSYESNIGIINAIDDAFVKGKGKAGAGKIIRFDAQGNQIP